MLEAIDIVLICLGTVLSIFASIAIFLLLILKRRKLQGKSPGSSAKVAAAKEYYLDHPPTISAAAKNGEAPRFVSRPSATNVPVRIDDNQKAETKDSGIKESSVIRVEEHSEIRSHEEIHRSSNSIKRSHRPCRIKLSPDLAKAAQAEAVQSEHTLDNFMRDLSRIRNEDDAVLYEEFQILEELDSVRERNCSAAEKERTRNRFVDILPSKWSSIYLQGRSYRVSGDSTRVILHGSNDYINASLIDGYRTAGQFIATQGPIGPEEATDGRKKSTVDDFWRMIWEKNVQCIIMLTDCVENMRQRCSKYWPSLGEVQRFGEVEVDMISESEDPICLHREFDIKKNGERRQISQYHFLNWYDAKGPENAAYLLDFIERIWHKQYRKPIVVHCSAGVGRTGVLIALWILLERARQERKVDIFAGSSINTCEGLELVFLSLEYDIVMGDRSRKVIPLLLAGGSARPVL
ncbi:unnamed protein product [Haemonchus placei]|uniref:Tyrosine-protein phosphatase domain-containing protein n=1 Tax=Haemonchus placei TaxID=6290 RepID=A0A0N4W3G3_HAEPC|nr:unnamed protein product [Haemonchus placei]